MTKIARHHDEVWTQTVFYEGEGTKGGGNCTEAAIATLFGVPLDEIPVLHDPNLANNDPKQVRQFWDRFEAVFESFGYRAHVQSPEFGHPDCLHLVSGPASRGANHMVVYNGSELFWDPHPSREGLLSVKHIWWSMPIDPKLVRIEVTS